MTPGDVAASLLNLAYSHESIRGKTVYDLGCGTGRLAIGAALLGAEEVLGVDVDGEALEIADKNAGQVEVEVEWREAEVEGLELSKADTVIQNPPFGVQKKGADMVFLEKALELGDEVYSIHKGVPKNREFISNQVRN